MAKAVVSYINFFDSELKIEAVEVESQCWREAVRASTFGDDLAWIADGDYETIEEARNAAFDGEQEFMVVFINE